MKFDVIRIFYNAAIEVKFIVTPHGDILEKIDTFDLVDLKGEVCRVIWNAGESRECTISLLLPFDEAEGLGVALRMMEPHADFGRIVIGKWEDKNEHN